MFIIGLDNGIYVKSNKRIITREQLPNDIIYPFSEEYEGSVEIVYWRKCWGLRNDIMNTFGWRTRPFDEWEFEISTPAQVIDLIALIAKWLDKERWENEGDSIWEYDEVREMLIQQIINLALIHGYMSSNPDVYLVFYDSY